jgi:hypothetical protein
VPPGQWIDCHYSLPGQVLYSVRPRWYYCLAPCGGPLPVHMSGGYSVTTKCLCLATGAPWYVSNEQIHEDLDVPLFADNVRALTASFDSKLADVGNPPVWKLDRYADRGLTSSPDAKAKGGSGQQTSRGHRPRWPSRQNESRTALISRAPFGYPDRVFRDFNINIYLTAIGLSPGGSGFLTRIQESVVILLLNLRREGYMRSML